MVKKPQTISKRYNKMISQQGINLLKRLLELNPGKRITAQEALMHPYFDDVRPASLHYCLPASGKKDSSNDEESIYKFNAHNQKEKNYKSDEFQIKKKQKELLIQPNSTGNLKNKQGIHNLVNSNL